MHSCVGIRLNPCVRSRRTMSAVTYAIYYRIVRRHRSKNKICPAAYLACPSLSLYIYVYIGSCTAMSSLLLDAFMTTGGGGRRGINDNILLIRVFRDLSASRCTTSGFSRWLAGFSSQSPPLRRGARPFGCVTLLHIRQRPRTPSAIISGRGFYILHVYVYSIYCTSGSLK